MVLGIEINNNEKDKQEIPRAETVAKPGTKKTEAEAGLKTESLMAM